MAIKQAYLAGVLLLGFVVGGCSTQTDIDTAAPPVDLGDIKLGHNIAVAKNAEMIPPSRGAEPEELEAAIITEIDRRFSRYSGDGLYHFGVAVQGYTLAVPGIPLVLSPKSALVISVNIYDDSQADNGRNGRLTPEPRQLVVFESLTGNTLIGSGLTNSREEQLQNLAFNAALQIEAWLEENRETWFFEPQEGAETPPAQLVGEAEVAE